MPAVGAAHISGLEHARDLVGECAVGRDERQVGVKRVGDLALFATKRAGLSWAHGIHGIDARGSLRRQQHATRAQLRDPLLERVRSCGGIDGPQLGGWLATYG